MKKIIFLWVSMYLMAPFGCVLAQETPNAPQTHSRVSNPDFLIDSNGSQFEIVPDRRAHTTNKHNQLNRTAAITDEPFTSKKLGVLINHSTGVELATTGEMTFKLKQGVSIASLQSLMLPNFLLVIKPDIYIVKASTPRQLVKIARQLHASPMIDWAEPFTVNANIN